MQEGIYNEEAEKTLTHVGQYFNLVQ